MPLRVYIAGPMTGLPAFNRPAFHAAADELRACGLFVCNPAEQTPPRCGTWAGWMRGAIGQLVTCDRVALLDGWEQSRGACLEVHIAEQLGIERHPLRDVLTEARSARGQHRYS